MDVVGEGVLSDKDDDVGGTPPVQTWAMKTTTTRTGTATRIMLALVIQGVPPIPNPKLNLICLVFSNLKSRFMVPSGATGGDFLEKENFIPASARVLYSTHNYKKSRF